jgi:methylated-DNA-protein-cysteine methyltransferase-like protein
MTLHATTDNNTTNFFDKVYRVVLNIPLGKVATYGTVAAACGNCKMARQVGWALHSNPYFGYVPCHRVVNAKGMLSGFGFGGTTAQQELLQQEGIVFGNNKIDLNIYGYFDIQTLSINIDNGNPLVYLNK